MKPKAEVVICGAGIAGISAAYFLAAEGGMRDIMLIDERSPLSLTSDKSTECYRNWWPGPGDAMVAFMNRSIDLLESLADQSGNAFHLNRRGYLYLTADRAKIRGMRQGAEATSRLGGGPLRVHSGKPGETAYCPAAAEGFHGAQEGADLLLDPALIRTYFPYITEHVVAALHVRRAGWFSAQQLGMYLLEQARACGMQMVSARVSGVETAGGRVKAVQLDNGDRIETPIFINAAGPFLKEVGRLLEVEIPVFTELHQKVAMHDPLGVIARDAPLLIWTDSQTLPWSPEEAQFLEEEQDTRWLLQEFPSGVHTRPEGGPGSTTVLMLWEYREERVEPSWPPALDAQYPDIVLRGMAAMLPGLEAYFQKAPRPVIDGGYYTKTLENRPLIGPLPVTGAYAIGALSGYGLMSACAAGELLAAHVCGSALPAYAPAFGLERYSDPHYRRSLEHWGESGQL